MVTYFKISDNTRPELCFGLGMLIIRAKVGARSVRLTVVSNFTPSFIPGPAITRGTDIE